MTTALEMTTRSLPDTRWQAVLARDRPSGGRFVYAVRSAGIYCRPSCPSRRPHRSRVEFFGLAALAERAGFRPCRRCKPERAAIGDPTLELAQQVCRLIDERPDGDVSLQRLSREAGRSPSYLHRTFKRVVGVTPRQYAASRRLPRLQG